MIAAVVVLSALLALALAACAYLQATLGLAGKRLDQAAERERAADLLADRLRDERDAAYAQLDDLTERGHRLRAEAAAADDRGRRAVKLLTDTIERERAGTAAAVLGLSALLHTERTERARTLVAAVALVADQLAGELRTAVAALGLGQRQPPAPLPSGEHYIAGDGVLDQVADVAGDLDVAVLPEHMWREAVWR